MNKLRVITGAAAIAGAFSCAPKTEPVMACRRGEVSTKFQQVTPESDMTTKCTNAVGMMYVAKVGDDVYRTFPSKEPKRIVKIDYEGVEFEVSSTKGKLHYGETFRVDQGNIRFDKIDGKYYVKVVVNDPETTCNYDHMKRPQAIY